jgi:RNase P/RNase MRP subunit POP5
MRFKRRYFCVEVTFQKEASALDKIHMNKLKHTNLSETVHRSIEQLYGDYGMAVMMPSFSVIYFNSATNLAILRTARDLQKEFHALLAYVQKLADFDVSLRTVHVSGSIK